MIDHPKSDLHTAWARLFLASLASSGVCDVVISPGSRSTPLALAASAEPRLRLHVLVDERSAAFFALGQARISGRPSVLICTSGTAAAHYLPALIEASQSHIPLIAVTADRPWDAYDCASSQTVDQVKLFGDCVRHYADLGLPDAAPSALAAVMRIAAQAVHASAWPSPGPVHVNARFRKPLEPIAVAGREPFCDLVDRLLAKGPPRTFVSSAQPTIETTALDALALLCRERGRGIVVCGPAWCGSDAARLRPALAALSARTGFAVWAEATSGVRFGGGPDVHGGFDAFLRSDPLSAALLPQLIIELGGPPVSSAYARFLSQRTDCVRVVVAPHGWNDPSGLADMMIWADPATLCRALTAHPLLQQASALAHADERWAFRALLDRAESNVWSQVQQALQTLPDGSLSEGAIAATLLDALPNGATLVVGNSLAVRDLDLFCPPTDKALRVVHQRGAAGIDGLIAGSAGARSISDSPLALLLGDLSALHDLGGLAALRQVPGPLVVVVVNNQGGRIFEELPLARSSVAQPHFERLFITPQHVDFMAAAAAFDMPHQRVTDRAALQAALSQGLSMSQPLLIECRVPENEGRQQRSQIRQGVVAVVAPMAVQATQHASTNANEQDRSAQPPLSIFVHGFLGGPAQWAALQDRLNRPSVALTLPGHGLDPWCSGSDFDTVVDALLAQLPSSEPGYELVGYSMGARIALALALRSPQQVRAVTLIGVDPGFTDDAGREREARMRWEDQWAETVLTHGITQLVEGWQDLPIFASQRDLEPGVLAAQRQQRLAHRAEAVAWVLRTLGTGRMPNLWARLPRLRAPVRVVSGALDEKFVQIGRRLQDCVPGLSHIVLPNVGHNVVLEAPESLLNILRTPYGHIEQRKSQENC